MSPDDLKVLYINKMSHTDGGNVHDSVHVMFEDGSMIRIQAESNTSAEQNSPVAAAHVLRELQAILESYPISGEEVYPICLGDTTCMYCNGNGCPNCRRGA